MATWITHLMIADGVLERIPNLDRHGFCVGNIAPDCNVENEDWTAFMPSREITHWMQGERKKASDCDAFCDEYILKRKDKIKSAEEYAFLLGYYSHLITDAAFQAMIRDEDRVRAVWMRIKADEELSVAGAGMDETWDSVKRLIPKKDRMREIYAMEAEYLKDHLNSGYLTEILPLISFPDYIDYLPKGCIVRKIGVMGYLPEVDKSMKKFISMSKEEYANFIEDTIQLVVNQFTKVLRGIGVCANWNGESTMNYIIKPMQTVDEIDGKGYVHYKSWQETYKGLIDPEYLKNTTEEKCKAIAHKWTDNILVAKDGDKVIGFVAYGKYREKTLSDCGEIFAIYVLAKYYGQKVGYELMNAAFEKLADYKKIAVWVLKGNERAINFYERYGFRFDGTEQEIKLGTPNTELRMMYEKNNEDRI